MTTTKKNAHQSRFLEAPLVRKLTASLKKMRPNEVFEPIVKYPYAVLQCNGLLDE